MLLYAINGPDRIGTMGGVGRRQAIIMPILSGESPQKIYRSGNEIKKSTNTAGQNRARMRMCTLTIHHFQSRGPNHFGRCLWSHGSGRQRQRQSSMVAGAWWIWLEDGFFVIEMWLESMVRRIVGSQALRRPIAAGCAMCGWKQSSGRVACAGRAAGVQISRIDRGAVREASVMQWQQGSKEAERQRAELSPVPFFAKFQRARGVRAVPSQSRMGTWSGTWLLQSQGSTKYRVPTGFRVYTREKGFQSLLHFSCLCSAQALYCPANAS